MLKCDPRAWARCPDRKVCASCSEDACFAEGSDCHRYNMEAVAQPMTNADRIRGMSDEELADILTGLVDDLDERIHFCQDLPECGEWLETPDGIPEHECKDCLLEWLRQPAKEAIASTGKI